MFRNPESIGSRLLFGSVLVLGTSALIGAGDQPVDNVIRSPHVAARAASPQQPPRSKADLADELTKLSDQYLKDPWDELASWRDLLAVDKSIEPAIHSEAPFMSGSIYADKERAESFKRISAHRQASYTLNNGLNVNYWQSGYKPNEAPVLDPNKLTAQIDFFRNNVWRFQEADIYSVEDADELVRKQFDGYLLDIVIVNRNWLCNSSDFTAKKCGKNNISYGFTSGFFDQDGNRVSSSIVLAGEQKIVTTVLTDYTDYESIVFSGSKAYVTNDVLRHEIGHFLNGTSTNSYTQSDAIFDDHDTVVYPLENLGIATITSCFTDVWRGQASPEECSTLEAFKYQKDLPLKIYVDR